MPAAEGKVPVTLNLPREIKKRIGIAASSCELTKSEVVARVLEAYLEDFLSKHQKG